MKRIMIIALMFGLIGCNPVFAGSFHHNTNNEGGNSRAEALAVGVGVGISANKNINENTVVGVNKNFNANLTHVENEINTKISTKIKNDLSNRVNTTDINENEQNQKQKMAQGQAQNASNKQAQSADNSQGQTTAVDIEGDEDNSIYMAPPTTTPMVGTSSAQITTPFGGAGFSKDAQYMIYKYKMDITEEAYARGYISEEERIKKGKYLYKKFIAANKKGLVSNIIDPLL